MRSRRGAVGIWLTLAALIPTVTPGGAWPHAGAATTTAAYSSPSPDAGVQPNEAEAAERAIAALVALPSTDMVITVRDGVYEVHAARGSVRFTRRPSRGGWRYHVVGVTGTNPIGDQDPSALSTLEGELAAAGTTDTQVAYVEPEDSAYPAAYERIVQIFEDERSPDLVYVVAPYGDGSPGHLGSHGSLDVTQSRAPLVIAGPGVWRDRVVNRAAMAVDIAPTLAWLLGVDPTQGATLNGGPSDEVLLRRQDGRVLFEALDQRAGAPAGTPAAAGGRPERVIMFISDGMSWTEIEWAARHQGEPGVPAIPNILTLMREGTSMRYGSMVGLPTVTFSNHTTVGTGAWPGHSGFVNNRWYERDRREVVDAIDFFPPLGPFFTAQLQRPDTETLHEAIHRSLGDWDAAAPTEGAFTAAVNEPSARGADYATTEFAFVGVEPVDLLEPATSPVIAPYYVPGQADTNHAFADIRADYRGQSDRDNLAQAQAQVILGDPTHPAPTFMYVNFQITDTAGHWMGPHGPAAGAAVEETDRRIGRIMQRARDLGLYDTTLWVLTADHGMEINDPARSGGWREALDAEGLRFVDLQPILYLMSMDVESSTTDFSGSGPVTVTFTVADDDLAEDGSTRPVAGATVTLINGDGAETSATTDAAGQTTFTFVPAGAQVTVIAEHPDFNPAERSFPR